VGVFERDLEEQVLLAFFVPGIVYMADAVGTQTKALVIRGLSAGVPVRRIMQRELVTGGLVGVILAIAFFAVGLPRWGEVDVVLAVALALLAACSTATLVAMAYRRCWHVSGKTPRSGAGRSPPSSKTWSYGRIWSMRWLSASRCR
jgi:magnesium transporter